MERLPKGFGSVSKMKGNRRCPYRVRIQLGYQLDEEKGTCSPIHKIIGYTKTKNDGIKLLQDYHDNPYSFENQMTFEEVYQATFKEFVEHRSRSSILAYNASFAACEELHRMIFKDIKVIHLQKVIDNCGKNYPTLRKIKVMFNQMYKYALKYDLVTKDYSDFVEIAKHKDKNPNKIDRNPFSKEAIDILWDLTSDRYYQIILMLIYTGVRVSELLELKKEDINLEKQYFDVKKSKTENGIRRVPIADCILPFFEDWYSYSTTETLLCTRDQKSFKYLTTMIHIGCLYLNKLGLKNIHHIVQDIHVFHC